MRFRLPLALALPLSLASLAAGQTASRGEALRLSVEEAGGVHRIVASGPDGAQLLRATSAPVRNAALRTVPGRPALAATWTELDPERGAVPHYALSLDGETFHRARPTSYEARLRHGEFVPKSGGSARARVHPDLRATEENDLFVVQYWTQGIEAYRDALRGLGVEIHMFLANNSNVVSMDAELARSVRRLPFVRWVGRFHPAYKLEETLLRDQLRGWADEPFQRVNVLTLRRGAAGQEPVIRRIAALGGTLEEVSEPTYLLSATLDRNMIAELARMDDVQWIDPWGAPETDMDIARIAHGANHVETMGGYTGMGVNVEVMDGGCETIHPDLPSFIVHNGNTPSAHGTCTSGIVLGTGATNFAARGAMPDAFLVIADFGFAYAGGSRYAHTGQLQALPYECVLQSNSWGSSLTTAYNSISSDLDLVLFDHDRISILQSQSNTGSQLSRPQAWAKNVIAVGGMVHQNTGTVLDDFWGGNASIGPAADGRIKPDLASYYDNTLCADRLGGNGYSGGDHYCCFGGTSGATPIVAGHLGLLYEMWDDGLFGNPTPGSSVFENRPFNTTAKALLINTALQWDFSGTGHDRTRTHQGWGYPRLQNAFNKAARIFVVDETDVLTELESTTYHFHVPAGTARFKATLVYRDPSGTTSSSQHRINDLDLKVTTPNGVTYWGNNGLLASRFSSPGGSPNTIDTVENVFLLGPQAGYWQVEVIASEVNQDSHTETGATDVDYALVVHEVIEIPAPYTHAGATEHP